MKTAMSEIKVDHIILQEETDKLLNAIAAYREALRKGAPSISANFERQAKAMDVLIGQFVDSLQPIAGKTIVEILNANNEMMLRAPLEKDNFRHKWLNDGHKRYIELTDRNYVHAPKKGFLGEHDEKNTAKKILRDYLDATAIYYAIVRKKMGVEVNPIMIEGFVRKGHEFISADRGNVVSFQPGGKRPK